MKFRFKRLPAEVNPEESCSCENRSKKGGLSVEGHLYAFPGEKVMNMWVRGQARG